MFSMIKKEKLLIWIPFLTAALLLTSCGGAISAGDVPNAFHTPSSRVLGSTPNPPDTPRGWHQLLPFDGIRPIYNPEFVPADEAGLKDGELVMGVAWEGEAKAYPVTVLRVREMVNDEMAGEPYLVSW